MFLECLFLILLVIFIWKVLPVEYLKCQVPHPFPCWPILGNIFHLFNAEKELNDALIDVEEKWSKVYSSLGYFVAFIGLKPKVWLLSGELVQRVVRDPAIIDHSEAYEGLEAWLGNGLSQSSGDYWKRHRKLINPAFSSTLIKSMVSTFNQEAQLLVERLKEASLNKDWIDIRPFISNFALRVVSGTMMGVTMDENDPSHAEYFQHQNTVCKLYMLRTYNPLYKSTAIYKRTRNGKQFFKSAKYLYDYTARILSEAKAKKMHSNESEFGRKGIKSFMHILLEGSEEGTFTDSEIREELNSFVVAGFDTSSVTTIWLMLLLGNHPDVQQKMKSELDEIFRDDVNREVTLEDLNRMKYMEWVVKEGLRLYAPVPRTDRVTREDLDLNGVKIKSGTTLIIPIYLLHRSPDAFERPNEFIPERFENLSDLARSYYLPFSAGPRNCIGQRFAMLEIKMCLAHLFRTFTVVSMDETDAVPKSLNIVQKPIGPVRIKLELTENYNIFV